MDRNTQIESKIIDKVIYKQMIDRKMDKTYKYIKNTARYIKREREREREREKERERLSIYTATGR